jgi:hypothetical protein
MKVPRFIRCTVCGALVIASALAHHEHVPHPERPTSPPVQTQMVSASSSGTTSGYGLGPYGSSGYGT